MKVLGEERRKKTHVPAVFKQVGSDSIFREQCMSYISKTSLPNKLQFFSYTITV